MNACWILRLTFLRQQPQWPLLFAFLNPAQSTAPGTQTVSGSTTPPFFGRHGTIFSAVFCLLSAIGSAFTQSWEQLFATRILLGIGMGSRASTVPIYVAENAPALIRVSSVEGSRLLVANSFAKKLITKVPRRGDFIQQFLVRSRIDGEVTTRTRP